MAVDEEAMTAEEGRPRVPRLHVIILLILVAAGLVRGLFWASTIEVFGPVDELQHYDYVHSVATRLRPPVVGRDKISQDALALAKVTSTSRVRGAPFRPDPEDPGWAGADSYEGVQPPLYYVLAAVPYRLVQGSGGVTSVYVLRAFTVLVALAAIPVAYLLGRALFPRRPRIWLLAPAVLVASEGFVANSATVGNDCLVIVLGGLSLLPVARAHATGLTVRGALATGLFVGLALLTKLTAIVLVPLVGIALLTVLIRQRASWRDAFVRIAAVVAPTVVMFLPWLAWNFVTYGATSAASEVERITGPLQPTVPLSFAGLQYHLATATAGYWDSQIGFGPGSLVAAELFVITIVAATVAVARAVHRRDTRLALAVTWVASAFPVAFVGMLAIIYLTFDGTGGMVGRHLYPSLVATALALVAGCIVAAGPRVGTVIVAAVVLVALTNEMRDIDRYVDRTYSGDAIPGMAPAVDQSWGDHLEPSPRAVFSPPCETSLFALSLNTDAPAELPVALADGAVVRAHLREVQFQRLDLGIALYSLPQATSQLFEVPVPPGIAVSSSREDRDQRLRFADRGGDPVARIYCPASDARSLRFRQIWEPEHFPWLSRDAVRWWPRCWALLGVAFVVAAAAEAVMRRRRRHRAAAS